MKSTLYLILCALYFSSCSNNLDKSTKEKNTLAVRSEYAKDIDLYYSEKAIKTAHLTAPTLMKYEDTAYKTFFPDGVKVDIYDSLGNPSTTLTAKYGEQDHTTNQMKARDSVTVISKDGKSLKTKELIWIPNENRMVSYGAVEIKNQNEIIYGDTLFADENLKRYVVKKVRGIVHVTK